MRNLRTEEEIIASWKGDLDKPMVSISCITYNHEFYIEDALEGFLIQETDFPFEVLIHDDASTDKTADIIRKYEEKYPKIIKPIYQTENQFQKGLKMSPTFNFPRAKGEYIALCEGDDYWVASKKLQTQKDFLDKNTDFGFCFHRVEEVDETLIHSAYSAYAPLTKNIVTAKDVILNHFIPTLSLFFRVKLITRNLDKFKGTFISGDIFIEVLLASQGDGFCFHELMGVYRHHDGGLTKSKDDINKKIRSIENYRSLYIELMNVVPKKYFKYIKLRAVLSVDVPLMRIKIAENNFFEFIKLFFGAFYKSPLWPFAVIKIINKRCL
jgi:glycosyltransferase involved in cell wall biosynthesis